MQHVRGKKLLELEPQRWQSLLAQFEQVWIDVGCGDGLFVYEMARENPGVLCVGFDPVWENMSEVSAKAGAKAKKGGVENALFLLAALETAPRELHKLASRIWVNYPWAGILRGVAAAESRILAALHALGKPGAGLEMNINYHVLSSAAERAALLLPPIDQSYIEQDLVPAYHKSGFIEAHYEILSGAPIRSSWAKHLALGSHRDTLHLRFKLA